MSAADGLSPAQFGFHVVPKEEWADAQDMAMNSVHSSGIPRRVALHPDTVVHTGQQHIYPRTVQRYVDNPPSRQRKLFEALPEEHREEVSLAHPETYEDVSVPEVMRHKGKLYMGEGHHRLAAARQQGKSLAVHLYDSRET